MRQFILNRVRSDGTHGILGVLSTVENGARKFLFYTLELPYVDNDTNVSSIPAGKYKLANFRVFTGGFKGLRLPHLLGTAPRTGIMLHPAEDVSDLLGCIGVSRSLSPKYDFRLTYDRDAIEILQREMGKGELTINDIKKGN
jgi:hypothetical protein